MAFQGKFKVVSVTDFGGDNVMVKMQADTSSKSDFAKYTPSGSLEFNCTNPAVIEQVKPGKMFLLSFTETE
jgi:hypothetical protein